MNHLIAPSKLRILFLLRERSDAKIRTVARLLKLSRNTVKKYFRDIDAFCTSVSKDNQVFTTYLKFVKEKVQKKVPSSSLFEIFPAIIRNIELNGTNRLIEWREYKKRNPQGFSYSQFTLKLNEYCNQMGITIPRTVPIRLKGITPEDMEVLRKWKRSGYKWKWERATVLFESLNGKPIASITNKVERGKRKIKSWIRLYESHGLNALVKTKKKISLEKQQEIKMKKEKLIKLLHEPPSLHGINRTSWSLKTLSLTFKKIHKIPLAPSTISDYFKDEGFRFVKARKVLTSPDPKYREKLAAITRILSKLGPNEKFFSVDEFGPFSIKIQGGRSFLKKGEVKTYPQRQISKGKLICTAALELSENQVTHFYSEKKNTEEMIRLLEVLLKKYSSQTKIYFSWDAASWHASKKLYDRIEDINKQAKKNKAIPSVELAPLPASAQFLNVIESVFSGLARAVIHNSNFESVEECKRAIDSYFNDRNTYFLNHPKRAGDKIWGKERNPAVFDEAKNFKNLSWR